ncbi:carbohydrate-binding family 9-like protein [Arcticibacter eurypsychrophilus]|uniref:carbohydrate-binding family 9-like protein n=1 Tax=Arcticibacter eurypsychrophilus TaxID=1434752 RepID=UPI000ACA8A23|nr:carbohydrate-binding family 9-like protein [Arcticibacter eurypsychrophilus]
MVLHKHIGFLRLGALLMLTIGCVFQSKAQSVFKGYENLFTTPLHYTTVFSPQAPVIDGNLQDEMWAKAVWSPSFLDIEGSGKAIPKMNTRMKMMWNDTHLFIAAELEETDLSAIFKKHDQVVYHDNDFELFIDPDNNTHQYFEIEVNAFNTIFDLFLSKPYRNNGAALIGWDVAGLRSAVKMKGTLNNPNDKDQGWTVEMAIPLKALSTGNDVKVPVNGDFWRINFSRVEWDMDVRNGKYVKRLDVNGKPLPEHNWVWSPPGVINMHYPERWGYLQFAKDASSLPEFSIPYSELQRQYLWLIYYKQKEFFGKNKKYATNLSVLGFKDSIVHIDGKLNKLKMEVTSAQFTATINDQEKKEIKINDEGLVI